MSDVSDARPIAILVAALGGEGGGVLTSWIIAAAESIGFPAQSTSIPGVAQRTGATTYYIEILPLHADQLSGARPILALTPAAGEVDLLLASELAEAARHAASGLVTPERTALIAATSRFYLMGEKTAMGEGRLDSGKLLDIVAHQARASLILDMEALAKLAGSMVNAVMLGTLAGSGVLPIPPEKFEAAIRAEGKAAEANLRGFRAGFEAVQSGVNAVLPEPDKRWRQATLSLTALETEAASWPAVARPILIEALRRLADYQSLFYARRYLDLLGPIRAVDERAEARGAILAAVARHLALRMSFEDVIRVAQVKADPARLTRIRADLGAKPNEPVEIVEFFKPGIEELCSILPSLIARPILALSARFGWLDRVYWGMHIKTTSIFGYFRVWSLAKLKPIRPFSYRYKEESRAIAAWLGLVREAALASPELAIEVAECANLIKGYGDTHKRGSRNYRLIIERVVRPALARRLDARFAADAVASARVAALADPEGESLARTLDEIDSRAALAAAAE
jgi:indolepyruvate ferredoxin oxidoreductase beta subunit